MDRVANGQQLALGVEQEAEIHVHCEPAGLHSQPMQFCGQSGMVGLG